MKIIEFLEQKPIFLMKIKDFLRFSMTPATWKRNIRQAFSIIFLMLFMISYVLFMFYYVCSVIFCDFQVARVMENRRKSTKITKNVTFCLLTLNACNFATTGSYAIIFEPVSDLVQNFRFLVFSVSIILLLFSYFSNLSNP